MIEPGVRTFIPALKIGPSDDHSHHIYSTALAKFESVPWTAAILRQPDVIPLVLQCRNGATPKHDQLFTRTLSTEDAIAHMITFFTSTEENRDDPLRPVEEVSTLYQLGEGGSGYPSILHGGLIMAMVDEGMGSVTEVNYALGKKIDAFKGMSVTGELNIKFLRPVNIPDIVIVTARLEKVERRRSWISCEVKDKEGTVLAKCSSVWVVPAPRL